MIEATIYAYLAGWALTTVGLAIAVDRFRDPSGPRPHLLLLAVVSLVAWPVLLLGAAEFVSLSATAAVVHDDDQGMLVEA